MTATPRMLLHPFEGQPIAMEPCSYECYALWQAVHVDHLIPPEVGEPEPGIDCVSCCWCGKSIFKPETCALHTDCPDVAPLLTLPVQLAVRKWQRLNGRAFPAGDDAWHALEQMALDLRMFGNTLYTPAGILAGIDLIEPPV